MSIDTLTFFIFSFIFKAHGNRNVSFNHFNWDLQLNHEIAKQISILLENEREIILFTKTNDDYENTYVKFFIGNSALPISISHKTTSFTFLKSKKLKNLVIPTDLENLQDIVNVFVREKEFYFIIINDEISLDFNELLILFDAVWKKYRVLHIYLLTKSDGIIAYNPFSYDIARSKYGKVVNLNERKNVLDLIMDLNGYPLNVEVFKSVYSETITDENGKVIAVTGADADVAYELGKQMDFTVQLQQPDKDNFGFLTPNGTFNGALGRSIANQVDLTLTGYFIKDYFTREAEFTVAVYSDQLCCYVPKADRVPQSILPLFSFSPQMWLCYSLSAFTCGGIWMLLRCLNLVLYSKRAYFYGARWKILQFIQIIVDTWIVWVRYSLRKFPKFDSEKFFLGSLCLVSVIFGAIFESSLATVYIRPLYYKDITSLRELDASGFQIYYKYASMGDDTFAKGSSELFTKLANKMRFIKATESVMDMMVRRRNFASITRRSSISLENVQYFASKQLFLITECPKIYTLAYIMPQNSPFAERVNMLLLRFLNAGLIEKWIDEMYFEAKLNDVKIHKNSGVDGAKVLTLGNLQLPFIILGSGSTLSTIILICEMLLNHRKEKQFSAHKKIYAK